MASSSAETRVCDRLVQSLHAAGVRHVFSLSGNQIMPVYDALIGSGIELTHTRHEAAAVFMAEAAARTGGGIGVALVTAGPGFGNALGALYSARMSETPVILLSGDSPIGLDGHGAFQEFDQVAAATPFVKASLRAVPDVDIAEVLQMAISIARDDVPGPVHVALPADVLVAATDALGDLPNPLENTRTSNEDGSEELVESVARFLNDAKRPLILTGPQFSARANAEHLEVLRRATGVPVVCLDSPRGLRDPTKGAMKALLSACDAALYLGKPVDFTSGFGDPANLAANRIAVVSGQQSFLEHAESVFGERAKIIERADPLAFADALSRHRDDHRDSQQPSAKTLARQKAWLDQATAALDHRALQSAQPADLASRLFATTISDHIASLDQPVVICDGGEIGQWAQGFIQADSMITNGPSGAIGGALPYAIGAAVAAPEASVVAVMGDGTAGFHFAEFETAARAGANVTIIIGNDSRWNAEHHLQINQFGPDRTMGCTLGENVRYDLAAEALGCIGHFVQEVEELAATLSKCSESRGPHCVNVLLPGAAAPVYAPFQFPS